MIPLFVKGFLMGTADVIPGVSGGTIALVVGIYTELIDSIKNMTPRKVWAFIWGLLTFWKPSGRSKLNAAGSALNFGFLLPLGIGIVCAILFASTWIPPLIRSQPAETNAVFFGLILASIYVPVSKMDMNRLPHFILLILAALLTYRLVGAGGIHSTHGWLSIFFSGAFAISAMILPGLSGAYILKILGEYEFILDSLHKALKLDWTGVGIVLLFIFGICCGLAVFSRILSWLLHHYLSATMAILAGIMLGALRSVWPYKSVDQMTNILPSQMDSGNVALFGYFALGIAIASALIYLDRAFSK